MSDMTNEPGITGLNTQPRAMPEQIYPGMDGEAVRNRLCTAGEGYRRVFGDRQAGQPRFFSAPGRTELIGNHTDHQRGQVIAASVDLDDLAAAAPTGENVIHIYSEEYGMTSVGLDDLSPRESDAGTPAALVRGVAEYLTGRGYSVAGFNAYVSGHVPVGSGLSSSAAFEVLIAAVISGLFHGGDIPPDILARAGQYAENTHFGKPCGLMDQMASAVGGVVRIDFLMPDAPQVERLSVSFSDYGYALCVIDTGASHDQLGGAYAAIPAEMADVAGLMGADRLCEIKPERFYDALPELRGRVSDRALLRAMHFYGENVRVGRALDALKTGDFETYLCQVRESGRSSWMLLQNIYPAESVTCQPAALALIWCERLLGGAGACRIHGGGFGGTIQAYVPTDEAERFRVQIELLTGPGSCRFLRLREAGAAEIIL